MDNVQFPLSPANVLIVDGSSSNIKTLTAIFKQKEYNVRSELKGELALQSAKENPPDIILINTNISDMDGYEVCENLKLEADLKEIPVIFISPCNGVIDKDRVFAAHGADYITMPFNDQEILARIETYLKLHFMEQCNKKLIKANRDLEDKVQEQTQQMEDVTAELKEFNIMLDKEITERAKTEEIMRESERLLRNAMEEAPVPVMLFTEDGEVLKISSEWAHITGYTIDDIPTTSGWADIVSIFKEGAKRTELNRQFYFKKSQYDGEYPVRTRAGTRHIWDFYTSYIGRSQDGRRLLFMVAVDMTERKRMDELQKSIDEERRRVSQLREYDKIKTEFFANISHELRTPINVIFSALQMHELNMKDCPCQKELADCNRYTKIMKQNCYRLLRLANNLIDITKIDAGYFEIDETNNDIISLVENITLSVNDYVEGKGLSLIFDTDVEEKIIACDPEKIERIILNLLSNAVKFTPSGGKIMVNIEDGIENICIRVRDTGIGIPADKLNSIFERFVQVDKSFTRDHEGSGIGLSLVKALVELHGGTVSVKSKEDCGTEIIIYLPCKLVDETKNKNARSRIVAKSSISETDIEFSDIYD